MSLSRSTTFNVKMNSRGGTLQSSTPVTLKNQVSEITSIEQIRDVAEIDVSAGATLIYNPINDKYEIRKITSSDVSENFNLDGGEF